MDLPAADDGGHLLDAGRFFSRKRLSFLSRLNHTIRKLAHFSEFFLLGAEMYHLAAESKRTGAAAAAGVLLRCNFCALIDETIQIFSGRGPDIKDVWLDTFGAASGILITLLILSVRNSLADKERGKERADK